ncbi:MAG TPA: DUF1990 domain-containing protein [Micromonosporaceae bacterium]|nr:DUF1990 domain-containing protein [Micromonosporaceae bacterium]
MLTYPEVGATRGDDLPPGYHHVRRHVAVGRGDAAFRRAADALGRWQAQRGAGLVVRTTADRAQVGARLEIGLGVGRVRLWAPGEVVWVVDEAQRYGFAYGTLSGHPEAGEEAFVVSQAADGTVWFDIRAFSRPARWYARLGGPVTRRVQSAVTDRYVAVIARIAAS